MNIIIVEDDVNINKHLKLYLEKENYFVNSFYNAEDAISHISNKNKVDFIITDLNLPKMSGELFTEFIKRDYNIPVIMLTAKTNIKNIINGLDIGADDYITKPFNMDELIARIKTVSKRYNIAKGTLLFKNSYLEVYKDNNITIVRGNKTELTSAEYLILEFLILNKNIILSREVILENINSYNFESSDRVIDAHIKSIRKKIMDDVKNPLFIKTIYGGGYMFIGDENA